MKQHHIINFFSLAEAPLAELEAHVGEFVVLVDGKIKSFHQSNKEALLAAGKFYGDTKFSVTRVDHCPVDLGFVDFADNHRKDT